MQSQDYNVTAGQGQALLNSIRNLNLDFELDDLQLYRYFDVDASLRIYSINISNPWLHPWVNPEVVLAGSYPNNEFEAMIPQGDMQVRATPNNIFVSSTVAVGSQFFFSNGSLTQFNNTDDVLKVSVSGTFDATNFGGAKRDSLWIFVDDTVFDKLVTLYAKNATTEVYTYAASVTVKTSGFIIPDANDYDNVAILKQQIETQILPNSAQYGVWEETAQTSSATVKKENRNRDVTSFGFAILGGILLVTLFSYLLSRFRQREIAILKAMGYAKSSIRLTLIAEILTTAMTGFITGMIAANGILLYLSLRDLNIVRRSAFLRLEAIGASFAIIVLVTLPGMVLATFRALRVSPMEAFRDRA